MTKISLVEKIQVLSQLHEERDLILANSWDVMSTRLAKQCGVKAIATTSAGISWSLGYPDKLVS
ncbi:isocitrate lyase/phosphoenolpyruvate mutase family protein [Xenorhabdus budapestensis]|uniref:Carboxyvinyl-carboxyphosphonate phosphorylmutase n=1 Tax=Xenorhabdus budapestensis TaxID=290110 RepID=A0A2D0IZB0_XENBU|nr:carboxyvinyl-carboxyphosphonate phosphorylmutase [Xenorhabdus budapestensis]